jgi:hypothetical protein
MYSDLHVQASLPVAVPLWPLKVAAVTPAATGARFFHSQLDTNV